MKLELFFTNYCPYCQVVLAEIKFLGLAEEILMYDTMSDPIASARHLEKTGRRTVPCLYIDDEPMFESSDIISWLKENASKLKGK